MRIAFDGTSLRPRRTGVGYYTEHLLRHLALTARDDELIVLSNRPVETDAPLPERVEVVTAQRRMPRMVWMQTGAPAALKRMRADVVHFTNGMLPVVSPVPSVVTIHDMSLRLYPRYHPARRVLLNRPLVDLAARRADAIVTVSEAARRDIVRLYRIDPARVHVVYEAAAPAFRRVVDPAELQRVRTKYGLRERVILYVGTIEPRKNLPALVEAFARGRRRGALDHQLVCVGPYGWLSRDLDERIKRANVADAIAFTGYVPFEDLPAIYSLAEMFVYPSMYEGFGLPVVEAMACGVPVITGRAAALAEVGGEAAEHVDQLESDCLADAMVSLATNPDRRRALSAKSLERSQRFSWERAAEQTLDVYRSVAKPCHAGRPIAAPAPAGADVLFGQAYFLRFDPKLWNARQPYPPLGSLYAAACVRERGYRVAMFDAMLAASEAEWADALTRHRPRFAVLYEDNFNYLTKMCLLRMREAAVKMIADAAARGVRVIVSGSDATDHPAIYLDAGAVVVVSGEGEQTLLELLDALTGRAPGVRMENVRGICYRDAAGHLRRSPSRDVIRELDALPFPAWDLVDIAHYRSIWKRHHGYHSMNIVTTRGCPFHCNWCAKPIYGQRYSARSPRHVAGEMLHLKQTYAPDHLWIADDIFGLKPEWIARFARELEARDASIPFKCLLRADQVTTEVAQALSRARCRTAWLGAESGSQRVLDAMEKGTRVEQIAKASRLLHDAGIEVGFFLQFGYPGETREDIDATLRMVRDCRPDDIGVSVSYPLPGTTFYQRVKAELGQKQNWIDSSDLAMMYRATYVPDFYRALHRLVHAEFRGRRAWAHLRGGHVRAAIAAAVCTLSLPVLRRRVDRLAAVAPPQPPVVPMPVLTPQAAAIPSEQPQ
jgi:glycosyltransferase involved in cell wall biosynthesis/radical SAM superfamily enzyme YgiQ (UPF0313 family)